MKKQKYFYATITWENRFSKLVQIWMSWVVLQSEFRCPGAHNAENFRV